MGVKNEFPSEFTYDNIDQAIILLDKYEMLYSKDMVDNMSEENVDKIKDITYAICQIAKDNLQHLTHKVSRDKIIVIYNDCKAKQKEYDGTVDEIEDFNSYYYKSIVNELTKGNTPYFFVQKNGKIEDDLEL